MTRYRPIAMLLAGAIALSSCAQVQSFFSTVNDKVKQVEADFQAWIASAESTVNGVIADVNSGIAANQQTFQNVCYGLGVAANLFSSVAPIAGASAADVANGQIAVGAANALCSSTPTDIGSAVAQGLAVYKDVKAATETVAPGATAVAAKS